jgi:putative hydrolase of the HAD superfamily
VSGTAFVFDFYGTLTPGRRLADQVAARREQAIALDVAPDAFDAELTATVDARFRVAGGDIAGSLRWVARRLGATPPDDAVQRAAEIRLASERRFGTPRPEAAEVLRGLREQGHPIGVVSDCSAELPVYFPELSVAPYVDAAVFSFNTGQRKPAPENFLACCAALGVAAPACVYVGDGGSDELAGARAVGMRAVHFAAPDDVEAVVYERHAHWDGEVIASLAEVRTLV